MAERKRPTNAFIADEMQKLIDASGDSEPDYRAGIINTLKDQAAKNRGGLYVRLPQPAPGHCLYTEYAWTDNEAAAYTASGKLPRDLTTLNQDSNVILLFIFDARGCGGQLPEIQFEQVPDLRAQPALCAFDMDGRGNIAVIPSEVLETIETGPEEVLFRLNEKGRGGSGVKDDGKEEGEGKLGKERLGHGDGDEA